MIEMMREEWAVAETRAWTAGAGAGEGHVKHVQRNRSLHFGRAGDVRWEIAWKEQDRDSPGQGDSRKGDGSGLSAKCHAPVGCSDEKAPDDLVQATFRREVGAEEGCVHSTNNGIRVRLEERCLFHYRRRREERHDVCSGRYVCGVWGLSVDSTKRDSSAGSEDGAGGLAVSWAGVKA